MEEFLESIDLSVMAYEPGDYVNPVFASLTYISSGLAVVVTKAMSTWYMWNYAPKSRPVNWIFFAEQIVQGVASAIYCFTKTVAFVAGQSVDKLYDHRVAPCLVEYIAFLTILGNQTMGSLSLALYRYVVLKYSRFSMKMGRLLALWFILVQWSVTAFMVTLNFYAAVTKKFSGPLEFCRCRDNHMAAILNVYAGTTELDHARGKWTMVLSAVFLLAMNVVELRCYVSIFQDQHARDKRMIGPLKREVVQRRIRGNMITLSTQVLMFVLEIFTTVMLLIQAFLASKAFGMLATPIASLCLVVQGAILSSISLIANPELRKHYFSTRY